MRTIDRLWQREHRTTWAGYPAHPAANVFPLMFGEEFDGLVNSIRAKNGDLGRNRLVVGRVAGGPWQLVDGRNRIRAMQACGFEVTDDNCDFVEFNSERDVLVFVCEQNFHRRQLTPSQSARVGAIVKEQFQAMLDADRPVRIRGGTPPLHMTPEEEAEWMRTAPDSPLEGLLFSRPGRAGKQASGAVTDAADGRATADASVPVEQTETTQEPVCTDVTDSPASRPEQAAADSNERALAGSSAAPVPGRINASNLSESNVNKPVRHWANAEKAGEKKESRGGAGQATALASKLTGAPARSIDRAAKVRAEGVPELDLAVGDGRITVRLAERAIKRLTEEEQRELACTGTWPENVPKVGTGKRGVKAGRPAGAASKSLYEQGVEFACQDAKRRLKHTRPNCIARHGPERILTTIETLARCVVHDAQGRGDYRGGKADLLRLHAAVTRLVALRFEEEQLETLRNTTDKP